jgi:hypothetical protein
MNRAVQGDVVIVEIFPEREWKAPADEVVDQDCEKYHLFLYSVTFVNMVSDFQRPLKTTTRKILAMNTMRMMISS